MKYKNINYIIRDDCGENKGGYFVELYKENEEDYFDYVVIHNNNQREMNNITKTIEKYIDSIESEVK